MVALNKNGFGMIGLLLLMPLLLTLTSTVLGVGFMLYTHRIIQHTCRSELLEAQADFARLLNELLALNPQARLLHIQYEAAKKTAATPQGAAILAALVARILAFNAQQTLLISRLAVEPARRITQIPQKTHTQLMQRLGLNEILGMEAPPPSIPALRLQMLDELLRIYETLPSFAESQRRQINWRVDTHRLLQRFVPFLSQLFAQMFSQNPIPTIRGQCAAGLHTRGTQWVSALVPARSF